MTTVINLLGGPSSGKSTLAAELYAKMKHRGLKVEMVREVAKKFAWKGHQIGPFDQLAIIGEQIEEESLLFGKVDYIVTDSPVFLGGFYMKYNHSQDFMMKMVQDYYNFAESQNVEFFNIRLKRGKPYDPNGRFETEDQALAIDEALYWILHESSLMPIVYTNQINETADKILKDLGVL